MPVVSWPDFDALPPLEKVRLLGELWDRMAAQPSSVPVPPEVEQELDRRLERHRAEPDKVVRWDDALSRIRRR